VREVADVKTLSGADAFVPVVLDSLRAQVARRIRAAIVTGEIESGRVYSARAYAEMLGVSPTPVREALVDLATDGLVVSVRNRGFLVPEPTDKDLDEIFELRMMLEVPAVSGLAGHQERADLVDLKKTADRIATCAAESDLAGFLDHDRSFHLELLTLAGNRHLVDTVRRLRDEVRLVGLPGLAVSGELAESAREHQKILDLIAKDRPDELAALMRQHLTHTRGIWAGQRELEVETEVANERRDESRRSAERAR
jgi:DNA-binding GntR family transcriptional regulator